MRPQGASLLGSGFGLVGGFTSILQEGGIPTTSEPEVHKVERIRQGPGSLLSALKVCWGSFDVRCQENPKTIC